MRTICRLCLIGCLVVCFSVVAVAQIKKGKVRAATNRQLMGGLLQPNCDAIAKGTSVAPVNNKAWAALATNAAMLNEAGYLLTEDGRTPDAEWAKAAEALSEASAALLTRIESKDFNGAVAQFKAVTKSCADCHAAHNR